MRIPTNDVSNEIDLTQVIMGEFVVGLYNVCGVVGALPESNYFMPSSFLERKNSSTGAKRGDYDKSILEYKLYNEAHISQLTFEGTYRFGEEVALDIDASTAQRILD